MSGWDYEQPVAVYPPLERPVDKLLFWCNPPYPLTEAEYVQRMVDLGVSYSNWYQRPVCELAASLGLEYFSIKEHEA